MVEIFRGNAILRLNMYGDSYSEDYRPYFHIGRVPVGATILLILIYSAAMLVNTFLMALGRGNFVEVLAFQSDAVLRGEIWRLATYPLCQSPSLGFLIEMVCFYWFGCEVERFLGRREYLKFYAVLWLGAPAILMTLSLVWPQFLEGSGVLGWMVFLGFVMIYPTVVMLFGIEARWWAAGIMGIQTLMYLAFRQWSSLIVLWSLPVIGYWWLVRHGIRDHFGISEGARSFGRRFSSTRLRALPDPVSRSRGRADFTEGDLRMTAKKSKFDAEDLDQIINPLLDKIASKGIASLTTQERKTLEMARSKLLEADKSSK